MSGLSAYTRVIPNGAKSAIAAVGRFVAVRSVGAEVLVTLRKNDTKGASGENGDGESYTLPMVAKERWHHGDQFDSVEIQNNSGGSVTIVILIGFGSFEFPPV